MGKWRKNPPAETAPKESAPKAPSPKETMSSAAQEAAFWNDYAKKAAADSQKYATDNPYSKAAQPWIEKQLQGDMSANPWMNDLYGDIGGVNPYGTFEWLADYAGIPNGGQGTAPGKGGSSSTSSKGKSLGGWIPQGQGGGGGGARSTYRGSTSSSRSTAGDEDYVPDTITGSDSYFAQRARELFDPSTLDPANDPTLQPTIDAIQREAGEDYLKNFAGLQAQAEASGRFGGGLYQAMSAQQTEEQQEAISQAIAGQLMGAYQSARERQMQGLGLINQRDLAAMGDMTQRAAIDAQSQAAGAAAAAAAAEAAEQRKLQAANMLLGSQMSLMGMRGDMASLMQQGQQGAAQLGLGYGELGMSGFNTGLNAGQLGLGALQLQSGIGQNLWSMGQQESQDAWNRQFQEQQSAWNRQQSQLNGQQDALNDYLNILMGIGGMGGTSYGEQPGQYQPYMDPNSAAIMGAGAGAMEGWGMARQAGQKSMSY